MALIYRGEHAPTEERKNDYKNLFKIENPGLFLQTGVVFIICGSVLIDFFIAFLFFYTISQMF